MILPSTTDTPRVYSRHFCVDGRIRTPIDQVNLYRLEVASVIFESSSNAGKPRVTTDLCYAGWPKY